MTVGFFSPLPPARSGVADYSAALLNALRQHGPVEVDRDGDVNLYHLGNNQLHSPIYTKALQHPGVIVLHDAVLQHFALGYFSREQYIEEFVYNYGEWSRGLAQSLWQNRSRSSADSRYFSYPMLRRIVERSRAVVVHNSAAASMVRAHSPDAKVVEIPLLFGNPQMPDAADVERFRTQFPARPVFGIFGHLRESKRILTVLRVFSALPDCGLLLAGDIASSDLRRACKPFLSLPNVHRIGYLPEQDYWRAALAVDACINLRYPTAGESSAVSVGLMGAGMPVIMTDSLENSSYPDGACIKIRSGIGEARELRAVVEWARGDRFRLREIGENAKRFIREHHRIERVAALYWQALATHGN